MRAIPVVLLLLLISACEKTKPLHEEVIRPIAWMKVEQQKIEQVRRLAGSLAATEFTSLSFEVSGKVDRVLVNLGDQVSQDATLATLVQTTFQLSVEQAEGQLDNALASLTEAENEYHRYEELLQNGVVSRSGFDNAKAAFDSAKSAVRVARTQLDIAQKNLQDSTLTAPYDGVITARTIEPSQQISAGQSCFEFEGEGGLEVNVAVPENLIQQLVTDAPLSIHFPVLPTVTLRGRITELGTRALSANAFPVTVKLEQTHPELRAGMTAEVDFPIQGKGRDGFVENTVKVPVSAILAGPANQAFVFVYKADNHTLEKRAVRTENILDNSVFISDGLQAGEIIAVAGVAFLHEGQTVTLLDEQIQVFN